MRMVIMGPPGAGKGTQAALIAKHLSIPHISTGEIFRANVGQGTPLGVEAKKHMDAGEYVPDSVTNAMVAQRLSEPDAVGGFLLDGYPRTAPQVSELNRILQDQGYELDRALEITADTEEVVQRLLKRAQIEGRPDDTEDVIRRRMEVYAEQTEPLTRMYSQMGILVQVDGMGSIEDVNKRIMAALSD
ncbi:MAG: adenylate kinase [Candidatus Nanopelagicales bacterium]|nr:adenylate kinase [Candidatus Nanopelagicales bacterium]MDZ4248563.1 adenylate kinase [Candidatus Nanopelagicales bacterium]MDZ7577346.1 adenylate kinase [Candidatus Nanopelagicales bacterium]